MQGPAQQAGQSPQGSALGKKSTEDSPALQEGEAISTIPSAVPEELTDTLSQSFVSHFSILLNCLLDPTEIHQVLVSRL